MNKQVCRSVSYMLQNISIQAENLLLSYPLRSLIEWCPRKKGTLSRGKSRIIYQIKIVS